MRTKGTLLSDTGQALASLEALAQAMIALTVMFTVLLQSLPKLLLFYQGQNNGIYGEVTEDTVNNEQSSLDTLKCNFPLLQKRKVPKKSNS